MDKQRALAYPEMPFYTDLVKVTEDHVILKKKIYSLINKFRIFKDTMDQLNIPLQNNHSNMSYLVVSLNSSFQQYR